MTDAATLDHVTMQFTGHTAVDGVSARFPEHAITGLLGRNGAGKTTLMQLMTGHRVPTSGEVRVFGERPFENTDVLRRICFVKESQRYPDHFRVRDVLQCASWCYPEWDDGLARSLVADFDLPRNRLVKKLSRGMTSAVGIVVGLASRAPLTFFDEPYLGLDAVARQMFYDRLIADYAERPRTVVLSTHLIEEVGGLLEHVVLIDRGRLLVAQEADELRASALSVSGPTDRVAAFVQGREVLRTETVGRQTRAMVRGARLGDDHDHADAASRAGLVVDPVPLQQLVIALSRPDAGSTQEPSAPTQLEEVS